MSIDELEFDPEFQDPNRTYTPPSEDELAKTLEAMELDELVRKGGQSISAERYRDYQMEKGVLGDFTPAPTAKMIPTGNEFDVAVTKAAARLAPGGEVRLFGESILVKKAADGSSTWQRLTK